MLTRFLAFTTKYNGIADRIITEVKFTPAFEPDKPPSPLPPLIATAALWDTGATRSVITPSFAKDLGLVPTGTAMMMSAHGSRECNTYLVNMYLPNRVIIPGVLVSECEDTAHFGAIIGMDVIAAGDFSITNVKGKTWVSFRMPSIEAIDYAAEAERLTAQAKEAAHTPHKRTGRRIRRNDPCPCGSGEKYKKCCIDKAVV